MATIRRFEELEAWQLGRELTRAIYRATREERFKRDFALSDQMRRAAISVTSNIAEGFERAGTAEFAYFLSIAQGSAGEVRSQLYVALDEEYLSEDEFEVIQILATRTSQCISGLARYLRRRSAKAALARR